jgi:hypothetical protein
MRHLIHSMASNLAIASELLAFLWRRKLWWLIPMITVLMFFGLLMIFANTSGLGPLIYTLF